MTTSDAELLKRSPERRTMAYGTATDQHGLKLYFTRDRILHTERRGVREGLTPAPEPVPPLDEIAEIENRHADCDARQRYSDKYTVSELARDGAKAVKDRATLLRILRSRTFGVDKEALAKWFYDTVYDNAECVPSVARQDWGDTNEYVRRPFYRKAQDLIESGLLGGSIGNAP